MNSRQRRARIRAGMPGAMHRLSALCLMGDIEPDHAANIKEALNSPDVKLAQFEFAVRCIVNVERHAERKRAIKSYMNPNLGASYSGKAAYTIVFDEATTIK